MGARGPLPSENPKRRNKESQPVDVESAPAPDAPDLPETYKWLVVSVEGSGKDKVVHRNVLEFAYGPEARAAWDAVWSSELSGQFRPETRQTLMRWIKLVDRFHEYGEDWTKELLAHEKEFALTWAAQKRERLVFKEKPEAKSNRHSSKASSARDRGLRVV